jgi:hypothetical protein
MMVYDTRNYWVFGLCPSSGILKTLENTAFRKLDLFPSSGEGGDIYSVGSVRKSSAPSQWALELCPQRERWAEGEADHSLPPRPISEFQNAGSCIWHVFKAWCLNKHRDNLTFPKLFNTFYLFNDITEADLLSFSAKQDEDTNGDMMNVGGSGRGQF